MRGAGALGRAGGGCRARVLDLRETVDVRHVGGGGESRAHPARGGVEMRRGLLVEGDWGELGALGAVAVERSTECPWAASMVLSEPKCGTRMRKTRGTGNQCPPLVLKLPVNCQPTPLKYLSAYLP